MWLGQSQLIAAKILVHLESATWTHIQPPASAASVWTVSVLVPDSVQIKNHIQCLKNECSLLFSFSSFYHFCGQQVCAGWKLSTTYQFGFVCEKRPRLPSSTQGPSFSILKVCWSKVKVFEKLLEFICQLLVTPLWLFLIAGVCVTAPHVHIIYWFLVQGCFCAHFWKWDVKLHSNWEFILKQVFYLFNIHQYFRHVCPTAWSQSLTRNTDQRLGTREWVSSLVLHAPNNNTQLYHVSPYNNKHWIIDTLPELFKVTFCTQWMLDLHWSDEGRWRLICIGQGLDFLLLKPLVPVCCTLPGHFLLYLIKMFICTRKMQLSLSLYLASFFFFWMFFCVNHERCCVWCGFSFFLSFVWLINVCTTRVGLFPI